MLARLQSPIRVALAALALGALADYLFYGRGLGISAPLFVGAGLVALLGISGAEGRAPSRPNLWLGVGAFVFAALLATRAAPALVAFNMLAVLSLLLLWVACFRGEGLGRIDAGALVGRLALAAARIGIDPIPLLGHTARSLPLGRAQLGGAAPLARGLLLALPIVLCFGAVLAAADSVFASYALQIVTLQLPFDLGMLTSHAILILVVAWLCAGGIITALRSEAAPADLPSEGETQRLDRPEPFWRVLGWVEALTVLVAVDLLFAGFMLVQGAYFFGGLDTLERSGMSYADYARRGFFELVFVACMALGMLWLLAQITRRALPRARRAFNAANVVMIVLVLGLLASAFQRMSLYEAAYGYTRLRLYTHSFMIWLALVLVLFLVALLRDRPRLFSLGTFVSALAYLLVLNLANPDALIVRENVARLQQTGELDVAYLSTLGADAVPALADATAVVGGPERQELLGALGWQRSELERDGEGGWPAWHLGRAQALAAIERVCAAADCTPVPPWDYEDF